MKFKASVLLGICNVGTMEIGVLDLVGMTKGFSLTKIYKKSYSVFASQLQINFTVYSLLKFEHCEREENLTMSVRNASYQALSNLYFNKTLTDRTLYYIISNLQAIASYTIQKTLFQPNSGVYFDLAIDLEGPVLFWSRQLGIHLVKAFRF